jgi:hypothetical protein
MLISDPENASSSHGDSEINVEGPAPRRSAKNMVKNYLARGSAREKVRRVVFARRLMNLSNHFENSGIDLIMFDLQRRDQCIAHRSFLLLQGFCHP